MRVCACAATLIICKRKSYAYASIRKRTGAAFMKKHRVSKALAAIIGCKEESRPQVVKKLWAHIKEHDLQDPDDKRNIICDRKFQACFDKREINMFEMNKLVSDHLSPL